MNFEKILSKLVSYPTISETSNRKMMDFINNYLMKYGFKSELLEGSKGQFNLHCRIGPDRNGGIILSGHTDVVPTIGQKWLTDPFKLTKKKNKLYGRGSCDMKGFISVVMSVIPKIKIQKIKKPLHLVLSYDEEIGCIGIQKLVPFLKKLRPKPKFCIVGEPTEMKLINQHKGKKNFSVSFTGVESHSSLVDNGVNAIDFCSEFINYLVKLQDDLKKNNIDKRFNPPYPTINIGLISGGIAVNIIPKDCRLEFEVRDTPSLDYDKLLEKITTFIKILETKMKNKNPKCSVRMVKNNDFPPLSTKQNEEIIELVLKNLKTNSLGTVSFGTEAGVFNQANFQTVVCGPGSINEAHRPNEFVTEEQLIECEKFIEKTINHLY